MMKRSISPVRPKTIEDLTPHEVALATMSHSSLLASVNPESLMIANKKFGVNYS